MIQRQKSRRYYTPAPALMYELPNQDWYVVTNPALPNAAVRCRSAEATVRATISSSSVQCGDGSSHKSAFLVQLCEREELFVSLDPDSIVEFEVTFGTETEARVLFDKGTVTVSSHGATWSETDTGARESTLREFATTAARRARIAATPAEL